MLSVTVLIMSAVLTRSSFWRHQWFTWVRLNTDCWVKVQHHLLQNWASCVKW